MNRLFFLLTIPCLALLSWPASAQEAKVEDVQTAMGTREQIIVHDGYTVSYNSDRKIPNWVAYELTREKLSQNAMRVDSFRYDPKVKGAQASTYDYDNAGHYDPCRLAPSLDMRWSERAAEESAYLSNVCPQAHNLYDGAWLDLEQLCRQWVERYGTLYIVCGTVFVDGVAAQMTVGNDVIVPHAFFKVIAQKRGSRWCALGFIFTNVNHLSQSVADAVKSVDVIELLTGHDFFWRLPQDIQVSMEASYNPADWSFSSR